MNKKNYKPFSLFLPWLLIIAGLSLLSPLSPAYAKKLATCVSTQWPHEKSDLLPDPALVFGKLPNGFRYVLMENHEPKDRVSMHLNIQAGSLHETDAQQGFAHYLEHMLFNGSEHYPPGELVKFFQSIGMKFGPDANAHTGFDETVYDVVLPSGTKKSLEQGLIVMLDYARGALLLESEIERERGIILAEKRTRDSVAYRTYVSYMKFLFPGSRVNERMPIGIEKTIRNADRALLKDYYDAWYNTENMILVMVGDFDVSLAESLIKSVFAGLAPVAARACPDMGTVRHEGIKTFYHFEKEAGNTETSIQTAWTADPGPDSSAREKNIVARYMANTILDNRLKAMMEKPDNPFTSTSVYSGIMLNTLGYAEISAKSDPENWKQVLAVLEKSLRQALEFGFTESELDRVRKEYMAALDAAVLKKDTRDSTDLARAIIQNLNDDKVLQSPDQEKELFGPFVQSLTAKQAHKAFSSLWNKDHRLVMVTGNALIKDKGKTPENIIRAVFDESSGTGVKKPAQEETVKFPYLPEPEKSGQMLRHTEIFDLGIEQTDFENRFRLNLKKTDFKKNQITAVLTFGHGKKTEPVPGLAMLAESLVSKSGLGRLTSNELERALAGKNTSVSFEIEEDCFLLTGETIPDELDLLFQLLFANLKDPGYRNEVHALVMDQFKQLYEKFSHSIDGAMALQGNRFLAGGDSRFGMPSYEEFRKLTPNQARSWIDPARTSRLELSVVGDFNPETVKKLASRYFGSLPKMGVTEEKKESLKFPTGEKLEINVETSINKGMVVMAWPTEDFSNIYRVRRLSVLSHVFSELLRQEIREKSGATYSQYAYNKSSRTYAGYGVFRSVLSVDPAMSEKIIQDVKKLASELVSKGITQDELKRAVEPVLTSIKDMRRTNDYWLSTVLKHSVRRPEQLSWARSIHKDYASVTVQDVHDLAKTYLADEKKAGIIVIKPLLD